jgi:hypothetical protein
MKVIARPIGTGKTRELLMAAYLDHAQVLTTNKRALQAKADAYLIPDLKIIDWNDMMYGNFDATIPLYINKAEDVLQELFDSDYNGVKIAGMSLRMED